MKLKRGFSKFYIFQKKNEFTNTTKLEAKLFTTAYLLAKAEVIIFNLPFFPGKPLWNAFIEVWSQDFFKFKLLIE